MSETKHHNTIIAYFRGDHTGFEHREDVTDQILSMSAREVRSLKDADYSTDYLVDQEVIEKARAHFEEHFGDHHRLKFGWYVSVVDEIRDFFDIDNLQDLTELEMEVARAGKDPTHLTDQQLRAFLQSDNQRVRERALRLLGRQNEQSASRPQSR